MRDSDGSEHVETFVDADGALRLASAKLVLGTVNAVPSRNAPSNGALGGLTINIVERVPTPANGPSAGPVPVGSTDLSGPRIPPGAIAPVPLPERVEIVRPQ